MPMWLCVQSGLKPWPESPGCRPQSHWRCLDAHISCVWHTHRFQSRLTLQFGDRTILCSHAHAHLSHFAILNELRVVVLDQPNCLPRTFAPKTTGGLLVTYLHKFLEGLQHYTRSQEITSGRPPGFHKLTRCAHGGNDMRAFDLQGASSELKLRERFEQNCISIHVGPVFVERWTWGSNQQFGWRPYFSLSSRTC